MTEANKQTKNSYCTRSARVCSQARNNKKQLCQILANEPALEINDTQHCLEPEATESKHLVST
jgi:hypothetical protein